MLKPLQPYIKGMLLAGMVLGTACGRLKVDDDVQRPINSVRATPSTPTVVGRGRSDAGTAMAPDVLMSMPDDPPDPPVQQMDAGQNQPDPPMADAGDGIARCRFDHNCSSRGVGYLCNSNSDCASNFCCTEDKNCNGGMCTIECDNDDDCPSDMGCEHKVCFFRCSQDSECGEGLSCEHKMTVCEWP